MSESWYYKINKFEQVIYYRINKFEQVIIHGLLLHKQNI